PDDDHAVVEESGGGFAHRDDFGEEIVPLGDGGRVARVQDAVVGEPAVQGGVHVVVLVGADQVVPAHGIAGQVRGELLQRGVVGRLGVGRGRVIPAVGVGEEQRPVVLGGEVVLVAAVVGVRVGRGG